MRNVKILLPARLEFSSGVRDIAREIAAMAHFTEKQTNLFRLVVDEVFMNAIRYGSNAESHIFFECVIDGEKVICAVEDEGKGEKSINAEELKKIIEDETNNNSLQKKHGRGLAQITSPLVSAFAITDKDDGGLRIEFIMERKETEETTQEKPQILKKEKVLPEKVFTLQGEIDLLRGTDINEEVLKIIAEYKNTPFRLVLDMEQLVYCNSSFLGFLAAWYEQLESMGGEVVIRKPHKSVYEIIDLVGLNQIISIED